MRLQGFDFIRFEICDSQLDSKPLSTMGGQHQCAQCGTKGDKLLICSRCKDARYCSAECQAKHYPIHKGPCRAAAKGMKIIYYFKFTDDEDLWAIDITKCLRSKLQTKFHLEPIKDQATATQILNDPSTKIVLALTPWIATTKNNLPIKEFIERGGTLLCCGQFSNHIPPPVANDFFKKMGFPWTFGSYCRTDDYVQRAANRFSGLPGAYSNKATRLAHVDPSDRLYAPIESSRVQSMVFAPEPVKTDEASVVLAKKSKGYLGYTGDVNDEEGTAIVVTSICEGLLR